MRLFGVPKFEASARGLRLRFMTAGDLKIHEINTPIEHSGSLDQPLTAEAVAQAMIAAASELMMESADAVA